MARPTIRMGSTVRDKVGTVLGCLLFAVCFGAVGAGATWVLVATVSDGLKAREWVKVKADVVSFDSGNVRYRYQVDGKQYTGDRMGTFVLGGSDNVDSWHSDMTSMLRTAKQEKKPITVFMNPDDPSQSMIDNTIRWNFLALVLPFALGFGGVGVGALVVLVKTLLPARAPSGPPRRSEFAGLGAMWAFTFMWNVISVPIAYIAVPQLIDEGEWVGLLVLLFPLIGALMLWGAITSTIGAIRRTLASALARPATPDLFAEAAAAASAPPPPAASPEAGGTVFARGMISDSAAPAEEPRLTISKAADPGAPATPGSVIAALRNIVDGRNLGERERAMLEKMTPEQRESLEKLARKMPSWLKSRSES
jgi:hypothetical protein